MAINKKQKKSLIEKAQTLLKEAETLVFVGFKAFSANDTNIMRKALKKEGVSYNVIKKTLLSRALQGATLKGDLPELLGEVAIAYGTDKIAPAREIHTFVKKHDKSLSILGGIFEGEYRDAEGMLSIATIPSQKVLYGQLVNLINSPLQGLVIALNAIAEKSEK
ncbi:MAG: 50S ribosomal protein L10 [Patescibacteria group bacterium]